MTTERTKDPARKRLLPHGLDIEAEYVGKVVDDIPELPVGQLCNARRTRAPHELEEIGVEPIDDPEDDERIFIGYCNQPAGFGVEGADDGRCKFHGQVGAMEAENRGAPRGNQNATTHGLTADPKNYHEHLPAEEKEFVRDVSAALEDRIRENTGDVDYVDRILARRIAIKLHIAAKATERIQRDDLTQTVFTEDGSFDKKHPIIDEIRMYDSEIVREMRDIGILDDPESRKADALEDWRSFVSKEEER